MHRNNRIFALFTELSEVAGDEYTPRLLMACAESLEELFNGSVEGPEYDLRKGGVSLEDRGSDFVMKKGCWSLAGNGYWEDDDPTADWADTINMKSMFTSIESEAFL